MEENREARYVKGRIDRLHYPEQAAFKVTSDDSRIMVRNRELSTAAKRRNRSREGVKKTCSYSSGNKVAVKDGNDYYADGCHGSMDHGHLG